MRAVNLIPAEDRRGAGGAAGRSGGGAYVLLGGLAVAVAMASAYVVVGNSVDHQKAELARVNHQADAAEAQAQSLAAYTKFTALRANRVETVSQLAKSRFDWSHALHEVARVIPENAWLSTLTGTTSPNAGLSGAGGSSLRGAMPGPAIELSGCTTSQKSVAKMMVRMRLIDGVQRVSLQDAEKADDAGGVPSAAGSAGSTDDCRGGHGKFPKFDMVVFFSQAATPPPVTGLPTTAAATSTTTPSSTTAPTASTAPAAGGSK